MLGIKKQQPVVSGVISAGMHVNGDCVFTGGLRIDGEVLGHVTGKEGSQPSVLVIGSSGRVQGNVTASHVVIDGIVNGPVLAHDRLELQSKAQVQGDVRYKTLEMQHGAVIAGQLQPQLTPPPAATPVPPAAGAEPALFVDYPDAPPPPAKPAASAQQRIEPTLDL